MYFTGEDDRHLHLAHPGGHAVSIAKAGITPEVHAQIRALPKLPVKLAGGDEVPPIVQGNFEPQPGQEVPESTPPPEQPGSRFGSTLDPLGSLEETVGKGVIDPAVRSFTPGAGIEDAMAAQGAAASTEGPGPQAGPVGASPIASATEPAAPAAASPKPVGGESSGPIEDAAKAEQTAIRAKATAETDAATRMADLYDRQATQISDHDRETQQIVADDRRRQDAIFNDVMNSKVDPNHYWQDKGTGGKLLAGIGMIFSGIGSGLTGGPNLAHQVIERAIERDLDAQKANIGKKQNLLSYYQRQTGDDLAARQLAKASMLNAFAGQVKAMAERSSSPVIKQNGEIAVQEARKAAFISGQEGMARSQSIKQNALNLNQMEEAKTVRDQLYGNGGTGPARPATEQLLMHAKSVGVPLPGPIVTIDREGHKAAAMSEDGAKAINEQLPSIHEAEDALGRLQQLHDNPASVIKPGGDIKDYYEKTRTELGATLAKALGRVTPVELQIQKDAIGSPVNQFLHSSDPFAAVRNMLSDRKQSLLGQNVWGYRAPAQVQERPAATGAPRPPAAGAKLITNGGQDGWLLPGKPLPAGWRAK